jgi:putative endonuclease
MENSRTKGAESESLAVEFLEKNGYQILDRNWYNNHHELDIIAKKDGIIAIVEVRSLSSFYFQEPYQSVNKNKQRLIILATNAYIRAHNIQEEVRFDIISIIRSKTGVQIEHIESAFYPGVR